MRYVWGVLKLSIILFGPYSHLFLSLLLFGWENSRRFVFQLLVIVKQTAHNLTANKNTDGKQWIAESITRWKKMATTWAHEKKKREATPKWLIYLQLHLYSFEIINGLNINNWILYIKNCTSHSVFRCFYCTNFSNVHSSKIYIFCSNFFRVNCRKRMCLITP